MRANVTIVSAVAVACLALAGCSSSPDAEPTEAAPSSVGETVAPTPDASAGGEETATADAEDAPDIAADDPYCALTVDALAASTRVADAATATESMMSEDIAAVNEWGANLVADTNEVLSFYQEAPPLVDDAATVEAFEQLEGFITGYTIPLAEAAANAESVTDLMTTMGTLVTDADTQELLNTAPAAATTIHDYTEDRCGEIDG